MSPITVYIFLILWFLHPQNVSFPAARTLARKDSIHQTKITFSISIYSSTENGIHSLGLRKCMEICNPIVIVASAGRFRYPQDGSCCPAEEFDSRATARSTKKWLSAFLRSYSFFGRIDLQFGLLLVYYNEWYKFWRQLFNCSTSIAIFVWTGNFWGKLGHRCGRVAKGNEV